VGRIKDGLKNGDRASAGYRIGGYGG